MALFIYPPSQVSIPGVATEATLLLVEANTANTVQELQDVNSELNTQTTSLQAIEADVALLEAKDFATETTLLTVATEATLSTASATLTSLDSKDFATETTLQTLATETTLSTVAGSLSNIETNLLSLATETTLNSVLNAINAQSDGGVINDAIYVNYSSTNLPGNASLPLELVASTGVNIKKLSLYDTSGVPCEIMIGAASSEVRVLVMGPGFDGILPLDVANGTRISIRRLDAAGAVSTGDLCINFIGQ